MEMGPTTIACSLYVTVIHVLHVSASSGETPAKYKEPSSSETEIYFITIAAVFGLIAIATCLLCGYLREHEEEPKTKPVERSTSTASSGGPSSQRALGTKQPEALFSIDSGVEEVKIEEGLSPAPLLTKRSGDPR